MVIGGAAAYLCTSAGGLSGASAAPNVAVEQSAKATGGSGVGVGDAEGVGAGVGVVAGVVVGTPAAELRPATRSNPIAADTTPTRITTRIAAMNGQRLRGGRAGALTCPPRPASAPPAG